MKRSMLVVLFAVLLTTVASSPGTAPAEPATAEGRIDAQAEVAAVLYAASATQAALAKSVDAKLRSQQSQISALAAFPGSLAAANEAVAILQPLVAADGTNTYSKRFLAAALYARGTAQGETGEYHAAGETYQQGFKIDLALLANAMSDLSRTTR